MGIGAIVLLVGRSSHRGENEELEAQDTLLQMLLASEEPALREYLQQSSSPVTLSYKEDADNDLTLQRIASLSLPKPSDKPLAISLNDVVLGLALLESRLTDLTAAATRIEKQSVTKDKMVWSVLGVFGAIIGVLGGMVTLTVGITQLVSG